MASIAERVAHLEGQSGEQFAAINCLDERFGRLDSRFERFEDKFDRRFMWLVGLQVATLLGVIALAFSRLQ